MLVVKKLLLIIN